MTKKSKKNEKNAKKIENLFKIVLTIFRYIYILVFTVATVSCTTTHSDKMFDITGKERNRTSKVLELKNMRINFASFCSDD